MELHIRLESRRNLSSQLYRQVREAILDGGLRAGERLPPTRELAEEVGVSRNTVLVAYERLRAEGFLQTRVGSGTFVSEDVRPRRPPPPTESPLRPRSLWEAIPEGRDLSASDAPFDLRPGIPDVSHFPFAAWRARMSRQLRPRHIGKGTHIDAAGHPGLRSAIASHVRASRGLRATPEDVFVANGSQQALDLIARVLLEPGDVVAVEDPGYPLPRRAFQAHGLQVHGVPVDADGLVVEALPEAVRMVYVTPSHQYPLGMAMSMERRQQLLAWARSANGTIVEDDYDSEFRFGGRPLEPLHSLDGSGRVLYVGSFSKTMIPALRLGFAVIPPTLHSAFRKAKYLADWHTAVPTQAAAARFIEDGLLAQHIRRMQRVYEERHARVVDELSARLQGLLTPLPSTGGLHLTALLPRSAEGEDLTIAGEAGANGVAVLPLSYHYLHQPARNGLLLGYGAIATGEIGEALRRLRRCLEGLAGATSP